MKPRYIQLFFFFTCFVFPLSYLGQESIDLFSLTYRNVNSQESTEEYRGFDEKAWSANLVIPVPIKNHGIFFNEINFFNYRLDTQRDDFYLADEQLQLTGIILKTGYIYSLSKDRTIDLMLMPRWMSDFNTTNVNHMQWGGIVSFSKKFSNDFLLRLGVIYNKEEFGSFYNPLIQMYWKISPKWNFTCSLPFVSRLTYQSNRQSGFGLYHFSPTTTYSSGSDPEYYYEKNIISGGLFYRYTLSSGIFIEGRGGLNLVHTYDKYQRDQQVDWKFIVIESNKRTTDIDPWRGQNYFLELRLGYNLDISSRSE